MPIDSYAGGIILDIAPVAKPRMTQRDRWKKRPATIKYWAYKDAVHAALPKGYRLPDEADITFFVPMAPSWSKKKKSELMGQPHRQRPDIDNYLKALLDVIYEDDACVWSVRMRKIWTNRQGRIVITSQAPLPGPG